MRRARCWWARLVKMTSAVRRLVAYGGLLDVQRVFELEGYALQRPVGRVGDGEGGRDLSALLFVKRSHLEGGVFDLGFGDGLDGRESCVGEPPGVALAFEGQRGQGLLFGLGIGDSEFESGVGDEGPVGGGSEDGEHDGHPFDGAIGDESFDFEKTITVGDVGLFGNGEMAEEAVDVARLELVGHLGFEIVGGGSHVPVVRRDAGRCRCRRDCDGDKETCHCGLDGEGGHGVCSRFLVPACGARHGVQGCAHGFDVAHDSPVVQPEIRPCGGRKPGFYRQKLKYLCMELCGRVIGCAFGQVGAGHVRSGALLHRQLPIDPALVAAWGAEAADSRSCHMPPDGI